MKLEDELRRALAPQQPPKDFAERVAAGIRSTRRPAVVSLVKRRSFGLAVAAALAIGTGSTLYYAHLRHVSESERARSEAVEGLRIAGAKLNDVHERLLRISSQSQRSR
jgi:hypothetical protein